MIAQLEEVLKNIDRDFECSRIMESVCLSIKDLESLFKNSTGNQTCKKASISFLNSLLISFKIKNIDVTSIFDISSQHLFYKIVKIDVDIEKLLKLVKNMSFYNDIINRLGEILKTEIQSTIPCDIDIFANESAIFLILPYRQENNATDESFYDVKSFNYKNFKRIEFTTLKFQQEHLSDILMLVLKKNLEKMLFKNDCTMNAIRNCNSKFLNTNFYVADIDEWVVDIVMKRFTNITKNKDFNDVQPFDNNISGKYISVQYYLVLNGIKTIEKTNSIRKEKAKVVQSKLFSRFFDINSCNNLKDLFVLYSDISHFLKSSSESNVEFNQVKEKVFYKILKDSTNDQFETGLSILMFKAKIKHI